MNESIEKLPVALLNSKALFNPYQYLPLQKLLEAENEKTNLLICDEVGVGKTFEAGIIMQELLQQNNDLRYLLICPPKLITQWIKEIKDNFSITLKELTLYMKAPSYSKDLYPQFGILPFSYFTEGQNIDIDFDLLIIDEAHYIRNKESSSYKYIQQLIENNPDAKRVFMTATPIFNKESDLTNLEDLLTYNDCNLFTTTTLQGEANCYDYILEINHEIVKSTTEEANIFNELTNTFENGENGKFKELAKYGVLTGFLKRASASSIEYLKAFVERKINLNDLDDFNLYYEEINQGEETNKSIEDTDKDEILKKLKTELVPLLNNVEDSKLNKLIEILNDINNYIHNNNDQSSGVIIFSSFIYTCNYIKEKLNNENYRTFLYTGDLDKKKANNLLSEFEKTVEEFTRENNGKIAVLICSDVAKEGLNLQYCQNLIHYDFPFTPAAMGQRNGRIYRKGQQGNPKIYYITVEGSYDDRLFGEIITQKATLIDSLAEEGKVAPLIVLPNADKDYYKKCIKKTFEEEVRNEVKEQSNNSQWIVLRRHIKRLTKKLNFEEIKNFIEARSKSYGIKIDVTEGKAGKYPSIELVENQVISDETWLSFFVSLYTNDDNNMDMDPENLQNYYKKKYEQRLCEFLEYIYSLSSIPEIKTLLSQESIEDGVREIEFKKAIKTIVGEVEGEFFYDKIDDLNKYKENFIPYLLHTR